MLSVLVAFAGAAAVAGIVTTNSSNRIAVHVIRRCAAGAECVRPGTVQRMKAEASQIWSSLDVRIDWIDSADDILTGKPHLRVMLEENAEPGPAWPAHRGYLLAAIHQPEAPCGVGLARVWAVEGKRYAASIRVNGIPFASLPETIAEVFLGRALGRALAHEIGHYLLPDEGHTAVGLMRARFVPLELLEPATERRYGLDASQRAALWSCRSAPAILTTPAIR